jgi:hypothetical protein
MFFALPPTIESMGIESNIENSHLLTDIFGRWPSFHDAELLRMTLGRGEAQSFSPYLQATIHVFEMTPQNVILSALNLSSLMSVRNIEWLAIS